MHTPKRPSGPLAALAISVGAELACALAWFSQYRGGRLAVWQVPALGASMLLAALLAVATLSRDGPMAAEGKVMPFKKKLLTNAQ
jgi:hypothetical protein